MNELTHDDASATPLSRRKLLVAAAAGGAALAAGASLGALPASASTSGSSAGTLDTLTWAYPEAVDTLDPVKAGTLGSEGAIASAVESLLVYDAKGKLIPALATGWKQTDTTTYVYTIRQGVKFWDGSPMTMDDVIFTMERLRHDPKSIFVSYFSNVADHSQTGPWEMTIKLKKPSATFIYLSVFMLVHQKKYTQAAGDNFGTPSAVGMSTGPYQITEYVPGDHVSFKRNDQYWGEKGTAANLIYQTIADENARLLAMQAGKVDGGFDIPASLLSRYEGLSNVNVLKATSLQMVYLSFCTTQKPWSDIHVRRALAHCFDKSAFIKAALQGNGVVDDGIVPIAEWVNVVPNTKTVEGWYKAMPHYPFDLNAAKKELALSSVPKGFTATIPLPSNQPDLLKVGLVLAQNASKIGIKLVPKEVSGDAWIAGFVGNKTKTGIQVQKKGPSVQDPADFPMFILRGQQAIKGELNVADYKNAKMDALLRTQDGSSKVNVRAKTIRQVVELADTDLPYVPLYSPLGTAALRKGLVYDGYHPNWWCIQPWGAKIKLA
jgi:peptide/nickel transport system substrate-binding protein